MSETGEAMNLVEGERVYVLEWNNEDWWYVRKHLTEEAGWVPAQYLKDEMTYTLYVQKKLVEKIEKLPVFDSKFVVLQSYSLHTVKSRRKESGLPTRAANTVRSSSTCRTEARGASTPSPHCRKGVSAVCARRKSRRICLSGGGTSEAADNLV